MYFPDILNRFFFFSILKSLLGISRKQRTSQKNVYFSEDMQHKYNKEVLS